MCCDMIGVLSFKAKHDLLDITNIFSVVPTCRTKHVACAVCTVAQVVESIKRRVGAMNPSRGVKNAPEYCIYKYYK